MSLGNHIKEITKANKPGFKENILSLSFIVIKVALQSFFMISWI